MNKLIYMIKKLKYGRRVDSETYIHYLRKIGMRIGDRTVIFDPRFTLIDETRPWLVEIGNDVQITYGVTILTHGYDWSVLKGKYGEVLGSAGKVEIGDNVFIGMNTTILKGVHIGNNVIIGAASLVNCDVPDDCVIAGNPAKVICTIEEYYKKRKMCQEYEATELVNEYRKVYGKNPGGNELSEFFWLFEGEEYRYNEFPKSWVKKMQLIGNENFSKYNLKKNKKSFENIDDFLKSV